MGQQLNRPFAYMGQQLNRQMGCTYIPERFTVLWDVDWLGSENNPAGITPFGGVIGTGVSPGYALSIARSGAAFTQMGFRQLLISNKELSQAEVNDVLRVMFPV